MRQLIFLIYLNRSGSTFLARLLDAYDNIGVTPEARIPDGITESSCKIYDQKSLARFLDQLYSNHKFRSWEVDQEQLKSRLIKLEEFPIQFEKIFQLILDEYFKDSKASICVYKSPYHFYISKIRKLFPAARFLFIFRDPRAIYNSQKKTFDTDNQVPMATDPLKSLIQFKLAYRVLTKYSSREWFHALRYEDLIFNPDQEIKRIFRFLNVYQGKPVHKDDYSAKLSKRQKSIHQNIQSTPIRDRINGWQRELDKTEIAIIQKYTAKELKAFGYEVMDIGQLSFHEKIRIVSMHMKFLMTVRGKFSLIKVLLKGDWRKKTRS